MTSKKGIGITIGILIGITASSFLIWLIPETRDATFVITDFENHLDGVKEIHKTVNENIEQEFQNVLNGKITPEEYEKFAEISFSQINSQLIQLLQSEPPEEWKRSYSSYIESLRQFNSYLRETVVAANSIDKELQSVDLEEKLEEIDQYKSNMASLIEASDNSRP